MLEVVGVLSSFSKSFSQSDIQGMCASFKPTPSGLDLSGLITCRDRSGIKASSR